MSTRQAAQSCGPRNGRPIIGWALAAALLGGRRGHVYLRCWRRIDVAHPAWRARAVGDATLTDDERVVVERYLRGATAAMRRLMT